MADLEELVSKGESIKDKKLKLFGLRLSGTSIVAAFAFISTIIGTLYGGFLMYQKVEGIANLDLGAIESQMKRTSSDVERIEQHADAIKIELKKDMTDLRNSQWSLESKVDTKLQSVDTKLTSYDTKLDRFEIKVEKTKVDMENRIQQSLDNPLAN
jgi:uncharacterized protein (DUF3084 family)